MLTVPIQGAFSECKVMILKAQNVAKLLEFRIDLMEKHDLFHVGELLKVSNLPVIFTVRRKNQGGEFIGSEEERETVILRLLKLKPDYVDLEYDVSFRDKIPPDIKVISSYHNFNETPEDLDAIYEKVLRIKANIYKLACYAQTSIDSLRMLLFVQKHTQLAGMCMGEHGEISRILSPLVGSVLCYAPLSLEVSTAPGQLTIDTLINTYNFNHLNRDTHIYALIGNPIDKSVSHRSHNRVFQEIGKNGVYVKILLSKDDLRLFFKWVRDLPFKGLSVTMPFKEAVTSFAKGLSPQVKKIGAMNTLVNVKGKWWGDNTDAAGAYDSIEKKGSVSDKTILIIGAGGTAKALAYEGRKRGGHILVTNRTRSKALDLAKLVEGKEVTLDAIQNYSYDILINTTPVGMGNQSVSPLPSSCILEKSLVFDVTLYPIETLLLREAKKRECLLVYGYELFAEQAFKQFEIWLGISLDHQKIVSLIKSFSLF